MKIQIPEEWFEKASYFRSSARKRVEEGVYWAACFEAQQSIELLLKGIQVALLSVHEFTHDLAKMLKSLEAAGINIPRELYVYADALTPHYTMARYPGRKPVVYDELAGRRCIEYAERIWSWAETLVRDP